MPPSTINHILDGSIKAQIVIIPIIRRIRPINSSSPFLHLLFFLSMRLHFKPFYLGRIKQIISAMTAAARAIYQIWRGTLCMIKADPAKPRNRPTNLAIRGFLLLPLFIDNPSLQKMKKAMQILT